MSLIQPLADGPLDIVGDIHGEIGALTALLGHLGYTADGRHPAGRTLVFVGDLVDRGPDSPAVLEQVSELVRSGRAQCILGNHELSLLREDAKPGNTWWTAPDKPTAHPMARIAAARKAPARAFLAGLPLVLERPDLRIVHACWHAPAIAALREHETSVADAGELYDYFVQRTRQEMLDNKFLSFVRREWRVHAPRLEDRDWTPVFMPGLAELNTRTQMDNPVAVLTSGIEQPTAEPFWAGGKWRMVERVRWWERYAEPIPVVVGHYWRRFSAASIVLNDKYGPDLLEGIEPHDWMGRRRNVYCVDFSVGARAEQRASGADLLACRLAALRVPEWCVMHDDGLSVEVGPPGLAG
ncbi:MAG: metallophosphoesterase [Gammaproteobacteria bacterium]|nr:metallophosphoesterase [Gammaproteobacteria bacterium]